MTILASDCGSLQYWDSFPSSGHFVSKDISGTIDEIFPVSSVYVMT